MASKVRRVLCCFCHLPIKVEHLAGILNIDGKKACFCNGYLCLIEASDHIKSKVRMPDDQS